MKCIIYLQDTNLGQLPQYLLMLICSKKFTGLFLIYKTSSKHSLLNIQ